jgi:hypothetical protein
MKKKLAAALCLAAMATSACAEESKVGTAWQCGRDYIVVTYLPSNAAPPRMLGSSSCGAFQQTLTRRRPVQAMHGLE